MSLADFLPDAEWRDLATCTGMDSGIFFEVWRIEEARTICGNCPVTRDCLADAMNFRSWGTWAGTTLNQRRHLRESGRSRNNIHLKVQPR
jgi:hypothetical protein